MTTFQRPGVYIQESLTPLPTAPTLPGAVTCAFVAAHSQGPAQPTAITSWSQYKALYGSFGAATDYLPFAVYQYFANGGQKAYIVRAVADDALKASVTLNDRAGSPAPVLSIKAKATGAIGNQTYIDITDQPISGRFNLTVRLGGTTDSYIVDRYLDVTLNPQDPRYLLALVRSPIVGSKVVDITFVGSGTWTATQTPATQSLTPLTGGVDGTNPVDLVAATQLLETIDETLVINLPGVYQSSVINPIIAYCESNGNRFLVVDAPSAGAGTADEAAASYINLLPGSLVGTPYTSSSYVAVYGPWLNCGDPVTLTQGATRLLPPGGTVCGAYALADGQVGPQQSAAGVNFPLSNVVGTEVIFPNSDLDLLNITGLNVIRPVVNHGICIMGARTLRYGFPDRYVAIRRVLMFLEKLLKETVSFALFEPNNERLWRKIEAVIGSTLDPLVAAGVLNGGRPANSYFVQCNSDNNPPASVAIGELHISVGVNLNTPAEFVIISISQFAGVTNASSTLQ